MAEEYREKRARKKKRKPKWKEQHFISDKGAQVLTYFLVCFCILCKTCTG